MTAYVVARVAIHDRRPYDRYAGAFAPVLLQHGGRLLASDETPEPLDGSGDTRKLVLLAFDTDQAAKAWLNSPEYVAIAKDRDAGAEVEAILARGP